MSVLRIAVNEQVHPPVLLLLMEGTQVVRDQFPGGVVIFPYPENPVTVAVVDLHHRRRSRTQNLYPYIGRRGVAEPGAHGCQGTGF